MYTILTHSNIQLFGWQEEVQLEWEWQHTLLAVYYRMGWYILKQPPQWLTRYGLAIMEVGGSYNINK